jgi:hypothetical protein
MKGVSDDNRLAHCEGHSSAALMVEELCKLDLFLHYTV